MGGADDVDRMIEVDCVYLMMIRCEGCGMRWLMHPGIEEGA